MFKIGLQAPQYACLYLEADQISRLFCVPGTDRQTDRISKAEECR